MLTLPTVLLINAFIRLTFASIIPVSIFAMRNSNKSLPGELYSLTASFYPGSRRSFIAKHWRIPHFDPDDDLFSYYIISYVHLNNMNISSLYCWDFTKQKIAFLNLPKNRIQKISDQITFFGNICSLDLDYNLIHSIDLRRTNLESLHLQNNALTAQSFASNKVLLPKKLLRLFLYSNPIGSLSNFSFPHGDSLDIGHCGIVSLKNVVFNSKRVELGGNPLTILQNVTFNNIKWLWMMGCNMTLARFNALKLRFGGVKETELYLSDGFHRLYHKV